MSALADVFLLTGLLWWALLAVCVLFAALAAVIRRRARRPQAADDTLAMVRQPRADDQFIDALERELAEMDKRIRGEL